MSQFEQMIEAAVNAAGQSDYEAARTYLDIADAIERHRINGSFTVSAAATAKQGRWLDRFRDNCN